MKLIISAPSTGATKSIELDDDILRKANLSDYRMGQDIDGHYFGEALTGYRFRITGGQDKEGFAMKQGVMTATRVMLLMRPGCTGYAAWRARSGERKRRSVRGCILGNDLASLSVAIVRNGEQPIEGLTDVSIPRRLGPKRANNIRKLYGLNASQQVIKFVMRRKIPEVDRSSKNLPTKRAYFKAPKVQRLVGPEQLRRRNQRLKERKSRIVKSSEARKEFISKVLAARRQQRLRTASKSANAERRESIKAKNELREARRKAFLHKMRKEQPAKPKATVAKAATSVKATSAKKK